MYTLSVSLTLIHTTMDFIIAIAALLKITKQMTSVNYLLDRLYHHRFHGN